MIHLGLKSFTQSAVRELCHHGVAIGEWALSPQLVFKFRARNFFLVRPHQMEGGKSCYVVYQP